MKSVILFLRNWGFLFFAAVFTMFSIDNYGITSMSQTTMSGLALLGYIVASTLFMVGFIKALNKVQ